MFGKSVKVEHGLAHEALTLFVTNPTDKVIVPVVKSSKGTTWLLPAVPPQVINQRCATRPSAQGEIAMALADLFVVEPTASQAEITVTFRVDDKVDSKCGRHTFMVDRPRPRSRI